MAGSPTSGQDLRDLILASMTCCYNESALKPHTNLFIGDESLPLMSDADEQLLLQLGFRDHVRLIALELGLPGTDECPKTIKIFDNRTNMAFGDAEDEPPTFQLDVEAPTNASRKIVIALPPIKFAKVDSITLFVEDNHGNELTMVHSLKVNKRVERVHSTQTQNQNQYQYTSRMAALTPILPLSPMLTLTLTLSHPHPVTIAT